jgi:hypothetical protein
VCGRATAAEEGAGSSGVDGGVESDGVERESSGDLESFRMKSEMTRGGLIFIGSKISKAVLNQNCC